jgi:hypothetical protein
VRVGSVGAALLCLLVFARFEIAGFARAVFFAVIDIQPA